MEVLETDPCGCGAVEMSAAMKEVKGTEILLYK